MKRNEFFDILAIAYAQSRALCRFTAGYIRLAAVQEQRAVHIISAVAEEYLLLLLSHVVGKAQLIVIEDNIIILLLYDALYSVVQSERRQHERRTSANAQKHHEYSLFIAHDVSC